MYKVFLVFDTGHVIHVDTSEYQQNAEETALQHAKYSPANCRFDIWHDDGLVLSIKGKA